MLLGRLSTTHLFHVNSVEIVASTSFLPLIDIDDIFNISAAIIIGLFASVSF